LPGRQTGGLKLADNSSDGFPGADVTGAKRIAMSPAEGERCLSDERNCRVATVDAGGTPHVSRLWYVWDGTQLPVPETLGDQEAVLS
jgi:hypothetical protein